MLFSLALIFVGIAFVTSECPHGWAEFDGECLYFGHTRRTWKDAEASCRSKNAYLATDDNPKKHEFIRNYLNILSTWGGSYFWLGGNDYVMEGQWRWVETGTEMTGFSIWGPGFPTPGSLGRSCMNTYFNGTDLFWQDHMCGYVNHHTTFNYICEKQATNAGGQIIG